MTSTKEPSNHPAFTRLRERIERLRSDLLPVYEGMISSKGEGYPARVEALCRLTETLDVTDDAVRAFGDFSDEFLDRQVEFLRTGHYRAVDFDAVDQGVYQDAEFMNGTYFPALMLAYALAPNYYDLLEFFERRFVDPSPLTDLRVVELGVGHGFLISTFLARHASFTGLGIDISPHAEPFSTRVSTALAIEPHRYEFLCRDLMKTELPPSAFDRVICAELLEHLPDPRPCLQVIHQLLRPNGIAYLSAAVRMESVDHLYLFQSVDEVLSMVTDAGFEVEESIAIPLTTRDYRSDDALRARLVDSPQVPVSVAIVARVALNYSRSRGF